VHLHRSRLISDIIGDHREGVPPTDSTTSSS